MKDSGTKTIICCRCKVALENGQMALSYQRQQMYADMLKCPKCGQVYIPEQLVKGKMFEVEKALEEK
ncbi:hypothetical protein SPSIL_024730 [Sporomusa silvacetica DSM 10669]|uniref:DUF7479 domain-containing protein n=1 Tax=Sporomusa silvacetica DSM 10669 TaxID=1123289 RepID=A0ABZ3ILN2_9FIRM|nr:CLJU_RS11820 family redox protein [Sporomusa silvacetica]OZC22751.1 hypothetical protein SPSIL_04950 [Sporomusa silvacetica DSM 10669]